MFDESFDKVGSVISNRTSDVTINPKRGEVMVTKTKETKPEEVILDIKIKGEVPREEVIPTFKKPNPKKTKKRGLLSRFRARKQRASRIKTGL